MNDLNPTVFSSHKNPFLPEMESPGQGNTCDPEGKFTFPVAFHKITKTQHLLG